MLSTIIIESYASHIKLQLASQWSAALNYLVRKFIDRGPWTYKGTLKLQLSGSATGLEQSLDNECQASCW